MTRRPHRLRDQGRRRRAALLGVAAVLVGALVITAEAVVMSRAWVAKGWTEPSAASVSQGALAVPAVRLTDVSLPPPAPVALKKNKKRRPARPASPPVAIQIPAIGVRARVVRLGLNPDRTLQAPKNFSDTGWWAGGAHPGDPGPSVVVGHVDSTTGPAVYYRLRDLRRGDRIDITRADRSVVRYTVQGLGSYPKTRFPTARVYGFTKQPTLRLITCSGTFDRSTGHYLDNTVVFATLAARH